MESQLLKGILEGCVLSLIGRGETYGYELLDALHAAGFSDVGEGTLYPVITRLEKAGYIAFRRGKSPYGPIRKYYSITESGIIALDEFKAAFSHVTDVATSILERKGS